MLRHRIVRAALLSAAGLAPSMALALALTHASAIPIQARILASVTTTRRVVALTFDDGPSLYTPAVLATLAHYRARATFFVVGTQVVRYQSLVRAERRADDEIGNHTFTHADLQYLSDDGIAGQIEATQNAVHAAAGVSPVWLRPPYGAVDIRVATEVAALGLHTILWSVDPRDWTLPGSGTIAARVLSTIQPGSVVILHDGGGDRSDTVAALGSILSALSASGYRFLTLSQLFAAGGPCDVGRSLQRFSARGIPAHATHAIFQQWENLFCSGTDLGPATSRERHRHGGQIRQDFATTGHRLVWDARTSVVRMTVVWPWAIEAFSAAGLYPSWHSAITTAWFTEFFGGHDWGPATSPQYVADWGRWERFRFGAAVDRKGQVTWTTYRGNRR
jgi:peptidoglycan/xylan/chitin deacetylase (PgdA/CDA1 family)